MLLTELFSQSLLQRESHPALEVTADSRQLTLTFGELEQRANQMARELSARNLERGDRLCVQLPNSLVFLDIFLACLRLGVIFVPVNTQYKDRELSHILGDCTPRFFVSDGEATPDLPEGTQRVSSQALLNGATARPSQSTNEQLSDSDAALIIYTSGTTGKAKGAVLSHAALAANCQSICQSWSVSSRDRYLAVLPLFHVHGLGNGVCAWLASGCLMRLEEKFEHKRAAQIFAEFSPTLFFGVPTIYVRLLDDAVVARGSAGAASIGKKMRLFVSGSAPLPEHVLQEFRGKFGHTILERYGMTEALMLMTNPLDGERRGGSVGAPFPGVEVRLVADGGIEAGQGETGELWIKSPHLFSGYWRNDSATRDAFTDGYFRTGDLATKSEDGYYTLRGRRGDVIISGGFNVYPREIEELLLEDKRVREVVVVGSPHPHYGEVPVAYLVADSGVDDNELEQRCRSQLAPFKVPRSFVRLDALPRTALGKVQRNLLSRES